MTSHHRHDKKVMIAEESSSSHYLASAQEGETMTSRPLPRHDYPTEEASTSMVQHPPHSRRRSRSKSLVRARKRKRRLTEEKQWRNSHAFPQIASSISVSASSRSGSIPSLFEQYAATETFLKADEHDRFWATLSRQLPTIFRVRCPQLAQELLSSDSPCSRWATPLPW